MLVRKYGLMNLVHANRIGVMENGQNSVRLADGLSMKSLDEQRRDRPN